MDNFKTLCWFIDGFLKKLPEPRERGVQPYFRIYRDLKDTFYNDK